jgi:hypothetical protein
MSKKSYYAVVFSIAMLLFCAKARGQATGTLGGTVTDKSGAVVAEATVTATSQGTGASRETKTDEVGRYVISLLPVGMYTLRVESQGFQPVETKDVKLQVDEQRELNFTLAPGTVSTAIEVSANQVAVETSNPSLGQVITSQQVSQLPLNGRDFVQLATLTPGTIQETNPNSFFTQAASSEVAARGAFSLSVGGSRPNSTDWLIDGVDNNELTAGGIAILSSIDSIQEFKVLTYNYSAEYGTRAGPSVLLTTKSGTNDFHGSLFEFLRNTSLDAKSFFASTLEKFNLNQFGGSIGGPIRKNKTFFFIDGEQKYQRRGIPFTGLVPSDAMRNGDFTNDAFGNPAFGTVVVGAQTVQVPTIINPNMFGSSVNPNVFPNAYFQCDPNGNPLPVNANGSQAQGTPCAKVPAGLFNPIGQAMMNLYPQPNVSGNSSFNFADVPVRKLDETKFDIRVDHNFSSSDTLFARFSYDQAGSYVPGGAPGFAEANAFGSNQGILNHARNVAIGETHIFSPTTVNQFSFGYNRIFDYITSQGTGSCISQTIGGGIPGANTGCDSNNHCFGFSCGLTSTIVAGGYWSVGDRGFSPFQGGTNIFSVADTLDVIRGKHDIRFGIAIRANQMNVGTEGFQDGFWIIGNGGNFTGFSNSTAQFQPSIPGNAQADFLLGITGLAIHDQTFEGPVTGRRWKIYRPFVQDDWRITKDLTLNLGLAWDVNTPISEAVWRQANYVPSTGQLLIPGQPGISGSAGVMQNWAGFEPRIGLAYKILGSDKTVFRAGYGIFHDSAWSMGAQGLWQNPPFYAESDSFAGAGCPFTTSFCYTPAKPNATGINLSSGFPIFTSAPSASAFTGAFLAQDTNFKPGQVQQFNANVERQLPGQVVLTVGYAGARGHHLLIYGNDLNTGSPSACVAGGAYTLGCLSNGAPFVPPYGVFNTIYAIADQGNTKYDSLQIKAETKTARYGLYALIGYTYSKTYDNGLSDGLGSVLSAPFFPLPNWQKLDWALSQIGANQNFTASVIYDLPFGRGKKFGTSWNGATNSLLGGWQLTVIEKITSGFPVPLIDSNNQAGNFFQNGGNGNNWNRPEQAAGCDPYAASNKALQYINAACFTAPPVGQLGNASRVPVYGPDFVNTDFSVIKQFTLPWENMGLNFRAEFFNLFNHAQFGLPVNDVSAPGFGSVNSTVNNPRLIQFGLKLTF